MDGRRAASIGHLASEVQYAFARCRCMHEAEVVQCNTNCHLVRFFEYRDARFRCDIQSHVHFIVAVTLTKLYDFRIQKNSLSSLPRSRNGMNGDIVKLIRSNANV